ncbi:MAG TPA: mycofactocin biosynthesis glycosyltransferase MftF [Ilumatobacteraceae bacterium]
MTTYTLDRSVRRVGAGRVLIGGSPLKLLRLTAAGATVVDRIERREQLPASAAAGALVDRLLDAGFIHPHHDGGPSPAELTVVIPAFGTDLARLAAIAAACADAAAVIVVDDGSSPAIGAVAGATVIRRDVNGGPGAGRDSGLAAVTSALVAFVDTDVHLRAGWLDALLPHFADPRVALVAPRVASRPGADVLARYETVRSPLDLGDEPARVRAGTRVSYVPAACVVARTEVLRDLGGFAADMRVGEDVDLVWRLDDAGHRVRYEPESIVHHEPRPTLRRWMRQRFDYGTSAAPLAAAHPGAVAPVRVSGWSALSWLTAATGWPVAGGAIAAATTLALRRKLADVPDGPRQALRLAGLGHLYAGRSLAAAVTRAWWTIAVTLAMVSRRWRRALLLAAIAPPAIDWFRDRPPVDPPRYIALRVLDDVSYGAGLTAGAVRARSLAALRPDFRSWPKA